MKICATTLGETAGDLLAQTMNVGFGTQGSSLILFGILVGLIIYTSLTPRPEDAALSSEAQVVK